MDKSKQFALEFLRANNRLTDEEFELLECFESLTEEEKRKILSKIKNINSKEV